MPEVITVGEILVEIMRKKRGIPFNEPADFIGPFPSGAPAIFADAVAKLGTSSGIIGGIGDDGFGEGVRSRLELDGVDTTHIERSDSLSTGVAFVSYFLDDSRKFIYHMGNSAAGIISAEDIDEAYVQDASVIHFNGSSLAMNESMREACYEAAAIASEAGLTISLDPNLREELGSIERTREILTPIVESASILTPTEEELQLITQREDEAAGAQKLLDSGAEIVAVKKGADGSTIYTADQTVDFDAVDVYEVDPTGAGDAFSAAIVVGYLENMPLETLGKFANATGGTATTMKGPMEGLASREEIDIMIRRG